MPQEPMTLRSQELSRLAEFVAHLAKGHCQGVLLEGPGGCGKTHLLEAFTALVKTHQLPFYKVGPRWGGQLAYGSLRPLFDQIGLKLPPLETSKGKDQVFYHGSPADFTRHLCSLIESALGHKPAVLVCEDIEHFEPSSLELITQFLLSHKSLALIVMTTRNSQHIRLQGMMSLLRKPPHQVMELLPLDLEQTKNLLASLGLTLPSGPETLQYFFSWSEGNPGFIRHAARWMMAKEGSDWLKRLSQKEDDLPFSYPAILHAKLLSLPLPLKQILNILSVSGFPVPLQTLSSLLQCPESKAQEFCAQALEEGWLCQENGVFALSGRTLCDQILGTLSEPETQELHKKLLNSPPPKGTKDFLPYLLYHQLQGNQEPDPKILLEEVKMAKLCFASEEGLALLKKGPNESPETLEFSAHLSHGHDSQLCQESSEKLLSSFEKQNTGRPFWQRLLWKKSPGLLEFLKGKDHPLVALNTYRYCFASSSWILGDFEKVQAMAKTVLESFPDKDSPIKALFLLLQAQALGELGFETTAGLHLKACQELLQKNLQDIGEKGDPALRREILRLMAKNFCLQDNLKASLGKTPHGSGWEQADRLAHDHWFPEIQSFVLIGKAEALSWQGRHRELAQIWPQLQKTLLETGNNPLLQALPLVPRVRMALGRGDWSEAVTSAEALLEKSEKLGYARGIVMARIALANAKYHNQDLKEAFTQIQKAMALSRSHQLIEFVWASCFLAENLLKFNQPKEAQSVLQEARVFVEKDPEIAATIYGALLDRLEGGLERLKKDYAASENLLKKALRFAEDQGSLYEEALVYEDLGKLYADMQQYHQAVECLEQAAGKWIILDNPYRHQALKTLQETLSARKPSEELASPEPASSNALPQTSAEPQESSLDPGQRLTQSEIVNEFTRWVSSSLDINRVLTNVIDQVMAITNADRGFLILLEEDNQLHSEVIRFKKGRPSVERSLRAKNFSRTIANKVLQTGTPIWIGDTQAEPLLKEAQSVLDLDIRTVVCMPMKSEGKIIGLIYVDRKTVTDSFTKEDLQLIESLATYATLALTNARLHSRVLERVEKLQMLNDLAKVISSTNALTDVLKSVLKYCLEVSRAEQGYVFLGKDLECRMSMDKDGQDLKQIQASKSVLQKAVKTAKSLMIRDMAEEEELSQTASVINLNIQSVICVPFVVNGQVLGAVYVSSRTTNKQFDQKDLSLLEAILAQASVAVENAQLLENQKKYIHDLERALKLYQQAQKRANTDTLTGLSNHGYFKENLAREFAFAKRYNSPLSVLLIDLDYFKEINDTYGHQVGDRALQRIGKVLMQECRGSDIASRYGGDEMAIILPNTNREQALLTAERLRAKINLINLKDMNGPDHIATSIGLAELHGGDTSPEAFLERVDQALYLAKQGGRDRVYQWGQNQDASVSKTEYQSSRLPPKKEPPDIMTTLGAIVQTRDASRNWQSTNLPNLAVAMGESLKLSAKQIKDLQMACMLRDIGNIGMPDVILLKTGKLDESEWKLLQNHPKVGRDIVLQASSDMKDTAEAIYYHHERWDGTGYPEGLKGEAIPLLARIVSVIDAYGAMLSERPYRKALSKDEAVQQIQQGSGKQFDPQMVSVFLDCIAKTNPT